jgi:carbonic anhydrase
MPDLKSLFENNKNWAQKITDQDPEHFSRLAEIQNPEYLWIGCSDSRVPANVITGLQPGEVFVHRNIANQIIHTDYNCMSVVQYAVDVLKVKHIIVCGHYQCGGVCAAMGNDQNGLVDDWLRHLKDTYFKHRHDIDELSDEQLKLDKLCEVNVKEQVYNLAKTKIIQNAWARGQELTIHGWIYSIADGILKDLDLHHNTPDDLHRIYHMNPR